VDPALLKAEGAVLQSIGEAVPAEATRLFGPSDAATAQLAGWLSGGSLQRCTEAWVALLKKCALTLDQNGQKLIASAVNYHQGDAATAQSFQQLMMPGPGRSVRAAA
jgi:hypothetical protein